MRIDLDDNQLDSLLRDADPLAAPGEAGPRPADELAVADALQALREQIVATPRPLAADRRRQGAALLAGVAACLALAVGIVVVRTLPAGDRAAGSGDTAEVRRDGGPHLLVAQPGWALSRVDIQDELLGEVSFTDGERTLDLHWRPAEEHDGWLADRRASTTLVGTETVAGAPAEVLAYGPGDYVALWTDGVHSLELRTGLAGAMPLDAEPWVADTFVMVAASLRVVGPDEWAAALPDSAVSPDRRADVVDAMLAPLPLPPAFDPGPLRQGAASRDRYQLGAAVSGAVACGWIEEWLAADAAGDAGRRTAAVEALGSSRQWPVLLEMDAEGDYPEVLWEYADAIAGDGTVEGGRTLTVAESFRDALGC